MIHCAEKLLKATHTAIGEYASAHGDDASFWRDIGMLEGLSLQELSLKNDADFFQEINSVLNVITTIIIHPHIDNERETIILRSEQAHGLTPEMFLDTVHDQRLWKDKRGEMTPAEVYYFQNVDRLPNYENRFIVHLIDQIVGQLNDYTKFYDYLLKTLSRDDDLTLDGSELETLIGRLETLSKKARRIKRTYFYREVSKNGAALSHVEATNVLKHNRLYNYCFRFYVRYVTYGDEQARADDLCAYFFTRMLLALQRAGYSLLSEGNETGAVRTMTFGSSGFTLKLKATPKYHGLSLLVTNREDESLRSKNLLLFDGAADFGTVRRNFAEYPKKGTNVEAVNVWDLAYVEGDVLPRDTKKADEIGLLAQYLADKTKMVKASRSIYAARCPVCGGKDVTAEDDFHTCGRCGSEWYFIGDRAWFAKLRKS